MINKVIRTLDKQGRLQLPVELVKFSKIKDCKEIALCSMGNSMIRLKPKVEDELKNQKVISFLKMDDKDRIIIPVEIRQKTLNFEIFLLNGDLILKEAPK